MSDNCGAEHGKICALLDEFKEFIKEYKEEREQRRIEERQLAEKKKEISWSAIIQIGCTAVIGIITVWTVLHKSGVTP
jgi:hypothetical protein